SRATSAGVPCWSRPTPKRPTSSSAAPRSRLCLRRTAFRGLLRPSVMKGAKIFDVYGVVRDDIETARRAVELALEIAFVAHASAYRGGLYYLWRQGSASLQLQRNRYGEEADEWMELAHQHVPLLLYVNESPAPDLVRAKLECLPGVEHIRRSTV